jgi:hypothetical protein
MYPEWAGPLSFVGQLAGKPSSTYSPLRNQCRVGPENFARAAAVAGKLPIIIGPRPANLPQQMSSAHHLLQKLDPLGLLSSKNHLFLNRQLQTSIFLIIKPSKVVG